MDIVQIDSSSEKNVIARAVVVLRGGGTLVYPTETVYGLGVDATNQEAVNTLLKFKGQRGRKPILIAVSDQQMAEKYVELNDVARRLYQMFLPGPVAIVSRRKVSKVPEVPKVPEAKNKRTSSVVRLTSGTSDTSDTSGTSLATGIASIDGTVGVRIPNYPLILKLIKNFGKPITSTSANVSGARNPWSINDIIETSPKKKLQLIDLILDAGPLPKRLPSTVVDTSHEKTEIVREGEVKIRIKEKGRRKKERIYVSYSPEETMNIAKQLMHGLFRPSSRSGQSSSRLSLSETNVPSGRSDSLGTESSGRTSAESSDSKRSKTFGLHPSAFILALQGPLGAGKTVFAKGVARALGITAPICSPSYTLVREYLLPLTTPQSLVASRYFYHIDAWRLSDPSEFQDFGLDRMLQHGNIIVIEWIERLKPILSNLQKSAKVVLIQIEVTNEYERNIKIAM